LRKWYAPWWTADVFVKSESQKIALLFLSRPQC
jgi:hypothetical protein